eukprot:GHVU01235682.1.p1 GENE.GHVU01235682.1~~GHVU01235682.1.p1  ORF type:complete len:330 (+),score=30.63 GHVU01235682.1:65-991(+)
MPLQEVLDKVKNATPKKKGVKHNPKKPACGKIRLTEAVGWGKREKESFKDMQRAIANTVLIGHPRDDHQLLVFTDASKDSWGGTITQVPAKQWEEMTQESRLRKPGEDSPPDCAEAPTTRTIAAMDHTPLAFISGKFSGAQLRWKIIEKEAFALKEIMMKFQFLMWRTRGVVVLHHRRRLQMSPPPEDLLHFRWGLPQSGSSQSPCGTSGVPPTHARAHSRRICRRGKPKQKHYLIGRRRDLHLLRGGAAVSVTDAPCGSVCPSQGSYAAHGHTQQTWGGCREGEEKHGRTNLKQGCGLAGIWASLVT